MKSMHSRSFQAALCTLALGMTAVGYAPPAFAQQGSAGDIAQARELLNEGLELRRKGDNPGALGKLRAAHALARTPITAIELGRQYLTLGRLVEARETFLSIARIPERAEETSKSKAARTEGAQSAEQVRARLPSLTVKINGVPADSVAVTIDGAAVPSEALAAPRLVDPGSHTVSARSTTGGAADTTVEVKEGENREVELRIAFTGGAASPAPQAPAGPEAAPSAPHEAPSGSSHVLEWSLLGAGGAVAIAGAVLLGVEVGHANTAATDRNESSYNSAKTGWDAGLGLIIAGGAAIATGGILWAVSGKAPQGSVQGSVSSMWLSVGAANVRFGGSW
jgi:hypothetical protein